MCLNMLSLIFHYYFIHHILHPHSLFSLHIALVLLHILGLSSLTHFYNSMYMSLVIMYLVYIQTLLPLLYHIIYLLILTNVLMYSYISSFCYMYYYILVYHILSYMYLHYMFVILFNSSTPHGLDHILLYMFSLHNVYLHLLYLLIHLHTKILYNLNILRHVHLDLFDNMLNCYYNLMLMILYSSLGSMHNSHLNHYRKIVHYSLLFILMLIIILS